MCWYNAWRGVDWKKLKKIITMEDNVELEKYRISKSLFTFTCLFIKRCFLASKFVRSTWYEVVARQRFSQVVLQSEVHYSTYTRNSNYSENHEMLDIKDIFVSYCLLGFSF